MRGHQTLRPGRLRLVIWARIGHRRLRRVIGGFPVNTGAQTIASLRSGQAFCDAVHRRCSSERAVRLAGTKNYRVGPAIALSGVGRGFQRFVRYIAHKDIVVIPIDVVCVGHRVIPHLLPRQTPDRPS